MEILTFYSSFPISVFFDETSLFRKVVNEPTDLVFTEIVQFAGYVVYMRETP